LGSARDRVLSREVAEVFAEASEVPAAHGWRSGSFNEGADTRGFELASRASQALTGGRRRAKPKRIRGRRQRYGRPGHRDCVGLKRQHKELLVPWAFQTDNWREEARQQYRQNHVPGDEVLARWGERLELAYWFLTMGNRPPEKYLDLSYGVQRSLAAGIGHYILIACGYTKSGDEPKRDVKGLAELRRAYRAVQPLEKIMQSNLVEKLPPISDLFVNMEEACSWLGISKQSMYERIARSEIPKPRRFGKKVVWDRDHLTDHIRKYLRGEIKRT